MRKLLLLFAFALPLIGMAQTTFPTGIRLPNATNDTGLERIPVISPAGVVEAYITKDQLAAQLAPPLTLQDVTDNGNTTTNDIEANKLIAGNLQLQPQGLTDPSSVNWTLEGIDSTLVVTPPTGGSYFPFALDVAQLAEQRTYTLPDSDGTVALVENLPPGGVQSVTGGTNITVDNTDPANPEVSAPNMVTTNTSQTITEHKTFSDGLSGSFANFGPFANALSLSGDDTGDANRVVINFLDQFDSFQGSLGFNSATDSDFTWENDEGGNSLTLLESGGANGLQYDYSGGPGTVYHSGNLGSSTALDSRYVNVTGDTMTGNLTAPILIGNSGSSPIRLYGSSTGDANIGLMSFYESNGSVRQGYVGFPSSNNSNLSMLNEVSSQRLDLDGTGGVNGLRFYDGSSNRTVWHSGNITPVPTSRTITTGNHLSGGGDLSANRTLTLTPTVGQWIADSQSNNRIFLGSTSSVSNGILFQASVNGQQLQYRNPSSEVKWFVDTDGTSVQQGSITAANITSGTFTPVLLDMTGSATYSTTSATGHYAISGKILNFTLRMQGITSSGTPSGFLAIQALAGLGNIRDTRANFSIIPGTGFTGDEFAIAQGGLGILVIVDSLLSPIPKSSVTLNNEQLILSGSAILE